MGQEITGMEPLHHFEIRIKGFELLTYYKLVSKVSASRGSTIFEDD